MATNRIGSLTGRQADLQCCQRRLEYLSSRLQDLAIEIGDGQGAVWLKDNMWFLNKPMQFIDDVLYSVGKLCNHLITYLTFHKAKLVSSFPFVSYMGILYEVGEILGIIRDMILLNPKENLSVKETQITLFWEDCTPFLFVFENSNHLLLSTQQIPVYMKAVLDLVPMVIQVGVCMYRTPEAELRGFDVFAETCIRLSKALVEPSEFLMHAEDTEPIIVPFLRQWIVFALELVQNGVKIRTDMVLNPPLSARVSQQLQTVKRENIESSRKDRNFRSLPDDLADPTLAPLQVRNMCQVRAACQPFRWIDVAQTRISSCPNEMRKHMLEEMCLKESQKVISDIFLLRGKQPASWRGIHIHCPLTKTYDEIRVKLFVKVKVGDNWQAVDARYDNSFGKGSFLVFQGCTMEGFVAIEERPMTSKEVGVRGETLVTSFDDKLLAHVSPDMTSQTGSVTMMVQPTDRPRAQQYREFCPEDFRHITSASPAVEIDGVASGGRRVSIQIPFHALKDPKTKILVLKYVGDKFEVRDSEGLVQEMSEHVYTIKDNTNGGTMLATVDAEAYTVDSDRSLQREMELILGRKHLCKLLMFVECAPAPTGTTITSADQLNEIVLNVVCTEKFRVPDIINEKLKLGMVELPKSQSPDRLLQQADNIKLEVKGSVSLDSDIPEDAYTLTYLEGSDNYVRFPLRITDCNGRVTFVLRLGKDNSVLHTFFCSVQELLALLVQGYVIQSQPTSPTTEPNADSVFHSEGLSVEKEVTKEEKEKEPELIKDDTSIASSSLTRESTTVADDDTDLLTQASLKILNRNSLVNLAKQIKNDESHLLGVCLGLRPEKMSSLFRMYRHSSSLTTFYVLYEWRGRKTQADLADRLIQALRDIGRNDLAQIVSEVRKSNRALTPQDFEHLQHANAYARPRRSNRR
ncbi:uncharacterized protein LOC127834638 isoform X2 [Dreissena polymorpha]|uniref:uncharacterized protein LOC127834638 isoform X2 n=1 Tax=Dreissena polymorpha TaxID=45954 RepID=UPI002264B74C|nr:uncharacterized protein LOC127834638 isoform X2 [Dreissena polymorpha]